MNFVLVKELFPLAINSGCIYRKKLISYQVDEQTSDFPFQIFRAFFASFFSLTPALTIVLASPQVQLHFLCETLEVSALHIRAKFSCQRGLG